MINIPTEISLDEVRGFYEQAFRDLNQASPLPPVDVSYYPYVGLNQTIRVRDGKVFVRIADMCREREVEIRVIVDLVDRHQGALEDLAPHGVVGPGLRTYDANWNRWLRH